MNPLSKLKISWNDYRDYKVARQIVELTKKSMLQGKNEALNEQFGAHLRVKEPPKIPNTVENWVEWKPYEAEIKKKARELYGK